MIRGLNIVTKRRPDGSTDRLVYAWRGIGAPRLFSPLGTPEFEAEYERVLDENRQRLRATPPSMTSAERRFLKQFVPPMLHKARFRDARKRRVCAITPADLLSLFRAQRARCAISGLRFDLDGEKRGTCTFNAYAPSLDRIKSAEGYVLNNVRLVLFAVNAAVNQWGIDTYLEIAEAAIARKNHLQNAP